MAFLATLEVENKLPHFICFRSRCEPYMIEYGLEWPEEFDCDRIWWTSDCLNSQEPLGNVLPGLLEQVQL